MVTTIRYIKIQGWELKKGSRENGRFESFDTVGSQKWWIRLGQIDFEGDWNFWKLSLRQPAHRKRSIFQYEQINQWFSGEKIIEIPQKMFINLLSCFANIIFLDYCTKWVEKSYFMIFCDHSGLCDWDLSMITDLRKFVRNRVNWYRHHDVIIT